MTTSSMHPTYTIIWKVPQLSSELQAQIQPQRPGRFSKASQRRAPIGRWVKKIITDIEYPFEHGDVIHYTLGGVSKHPVTTKIQESFLTHLPERKETAQGFHCEVTEFNGSDRRKLWMDQ